MGCAPADPPDTTAFPAMSLETRPPRRQPDAVQDKPQVDRTEHANLERAHAHLLPRAGSGSAASLPAGWAAYLQRGARWH